MTNRPDLIGGDEAGADLLSALNGRRPVTTGWRESKAVRRTAAIRRRRRGALGAAAALVAIGVVVSALSGGAHPYPPVRVAAVAGTHVGARLDGAAQLVANDTSLAPPDRAAVAPVVAAQQALTIKLLRRLGGHGNVTVSPASLQLALGMLQNGARGRTAHQIATALQSSELTTTQQNVGLATLTDELSSASRNAHIRFESANSLWQQQGFRLRAPFLDAIAKYYRSGVWQTDFTSRQGTDAINAWTSQHTHGKITKLFDGLDPSTVLVLANALYLQADWRTPFDKAETTPATFTTTSGRHVQSKFMTSAADVSSTVTSSYAAAQLPYRGGRFAALVVMPTDRTLAGFVRGLTPSSLAHIAATVQKAHGSISLPRFTTATTSDLVPTLQALGMHSAFGPSADLSGLSQARTHVESVVQRAYLRVTEKGTTAAAATGVAILQSRSGAHISFDRPFLFLVRDTSTGAILFASEIGDPTAG